MAIAQGRCLVGVNTSDNDFKTPEKTGGEKTHTLTVAEMPSHNHHFANEFGTNSNQNFILDAAKQNTWGCPFANGTDWTAVAASTSISYTGSSSAHNNLQPYLCVYIFKRTS